MSNAQLTQLQRQVSGLDTKFTQQMSTMHAEIKDLNQSFLNMFQYMTKRFDSVEQKLDNKADKSQVDLIYNQLDSFLKRTDTDETERAALSSQVNRHEDWIHQIARTTGDKLQH